jgi:thioesterase domain-containing protein
LDCPIIGINQIPQNGEAEPGSIRGMAKNYADRLQAVYPVGPYNLLGYSFGGPIAHELAVELRRRGCVVQRLILLDANSIVRNHALDESQIESHILNQFLRSSRIDIPEQSESLTYRQVEELIPQQREVVLPPRQLFEFIVQSAHANQLYLREHVPDVFDGDMLIFATVRSENEYDLSDPQSWRPYVAGDITVYSVDCAHTEMMTTESLSMFGEQLKLSLEA